MEERERRRGIESERIAESNRERAPERDGDGEGKGNAGRAQSTEAGIEAKDAVQGRGREGEEREGAGGKRDAARVGQTLEPMQRGIQRGTGRVQGMRARYRAQVYLRRVLHVPEACWRLEIQGPGGTCTAAVGWHNGRGAPSSALTGQRRQTLAVGGGGRALGDSAASGRRGRHWRPVGRQWSVTAVHEPSLATPYSHSGQSMPPGQQYRRVPREVQGLCILHCNHPQVQVSRGDLLLHDMEARTTSRCIHG